MSRGQLWSADFGVSLVVFTAAVLVAYTLVTNTLRGTDVTDVRLQGEQASAILGGEGYPVHWTNGTAIRAGLAADGQLSMRKAREMGLMDADDLRQALRITDRYAVYALDVNGTVQPYFGRCVLGDSPVDGDPGMRVLSSIAITGSAHPFSDLVENITVYGLPGFGAANEADVILLEGNLTTGSLTAAQVRRHLEDVARRGTTIVAIGDIGTSLPGVVSNLSNATTLLVLDSSALNLTTGELLNISPTPVDVTVVWPVDAEHYRVLATNEFGEAVYATWTYGDARFISIGIAEGARQDSTDLRAWLVNQTRGMAVVPWPDCASFAAPDAAQVIHYDRTLPHHDTLVTLRTVVWRA